MSVRRGVAPVAVVALALAGCSGGSCSSAQDRPAASCAAGIDYHGHFYVQWSGKLPAVKGGRLGRAVYPPCNDTGGCSTDKGQATPTTVWRLRGADPDKVVVGRSVFSSGLVVYGRLHADPSDYFRRTHEGVWRLRRH